MKLTWFGGTCLRVYLGGRIVVVDADAAMQPAHRAELLSAATHNVALAADPRLPRIDPAGWRPKAPRGVDATLPLELLRIGRAALLIAVAGEPPLVVLGPGELPRFGRWADGGVIVLASSREGLVSEVTALLDVSRPRLIALAADEQMLDTAIAELSEHLDGAGLVSLEPGLALEV